MTKKNAPSPASLKRADLRARMDRKIEEIEEKAKFKESLPARLINLIAVARDVGVFAEVRLTATGPAVKFQDAATFIDETLTYESEEWEVDYLERNFQNLKKEQDDRRARQIAAKEVWDKLTVIEREALKENIDSLK